MDKKVKYIQNVNVVAAKIIKFQILKKAVTNTTHIKNAKKCLCKMSEPKGTGLFFLKVLRLLT